MLLIHATLLDSTRVFKAYEEGSWKQAVPSQLQHLCRQIQNEETSNLIWRE
jgi:hypothetical protein